MTLYELYDIADKNKIDVFHYPLGTLESVSMPHSIGIDCNEVNTSISEKTHLAHELGHCMTGAFYNPLTYETRERMEARANRWAYTRLVPIANLQKALSLGITDSWDLAEYFEVEESIIIKAIEYYKSQNLLKAVQS